MPPLTVTSEIRGGLDVGLNPGSTDLGLATVSATVTCTDPGAPGGQAQLRIDFDQNGNDTSGETSVACGSADTSKTQTITAVQLGMSDSLEITAIATLEVGPDDVTSTADTDASALNGQIYAVTSPAATFPGDGSVTVTGFYNCGSAITGPVTFVVTAEQDNNSAVVTAGSAFVDATCNGTEQSWSVTIPGAFDGDPDPVTLVEIQDAVEPGVTVIPEVTSTFVD